MSDPSVHRFWRALSSVGMLSYPQTLPLVRVTIRHKLSPKDVTTVEATLGANGARAFRINGKMKPLKTVQVGSAHMFDHLSLLASPSMGILHVRSQLGMQTQHV